MRPYDTYDLQSRYINDSNILAWDDQERLAKKGGARGHWGLWPKDRAEIEERHAHHTAMLIERGVPLPTSWLDLPKLGKVHGPALPS